MPNDTVRAAATGLPFSPVTLAARVGEVLHIIASAIAASSVVAGVFALCLACGA